MYHGELGRTLSFTVNKEFALSQSSHMDYFIVVLFFFFFLFAASKLQNIYQYMITKNVLFCVS